MQFNTIFLYYPDPDQRFLKWIRTRPNDKDPIGSGSETLLLGMTNKTKTKLL